MLFFTASTQCVYSRIETCILHIYILTYLFTHGSGSQGPDPCLICDDYRVTRGQLMAVSSVARDICWVPILGPVNNATICSFHRHSFSAPGTITVS